jgi:hypothetical protein
MSEELKKEENILEKIKREIFNFIKKKEALVNELRNEFPNLLLPLMKKSDFIKSISWEQYTPYITYGDRESLENTREFIVYHHEMLINDIKQWNIDCYVKTKFFKIKTEEDIEIDKQTRKSMNIEVFERKIGDVGYGPNLNYSEREVNILKEIKYILNGIPNEFYKDLFGDSKITISKDGKIKVEKYHHD